MAQATQAGLGIAGSSGDPAGGCTEIGPIPCDEEPVPADVIKRPQDVWFLTEPDADVRFVVKGQGALRIEAPIIELKTTGVAATSQIVFDGIPFAQLQFNTVMGPTVGPPILNPIPPAPLAAWQAWKRSRGLP